MLRPRTKRERVLVERSYDEGYQSGYKLGKLEGKRETEISLTEREKSLRADSARIEGAVQLAKSLADLLIAAGISPYSQRRT